MRKIVQYMIHPSLPERLRPLAGLANNLWWAWHPDAVNLWRRLDPQLWSDTYHNPVKMLGLISQSRLDQLAEDDGFLTHMDRVIYDLNDYMESAFWFQKAYQDKFGETRIAYFSAEFGITEAVPIYSGGLGILAGDHLKSASDLGLPLVGVGLLYQQGYFQQYLNPDGWQQEFYPDNDFYNMSVFPERDEKGNEIKIKVEYPGRIVTAKVWRAQVGRTPLILLDTNLIENNEADRMITQQLYGGDITMRIEQEVLLGIGGVRALRAVGIGATVYHMNEGHSAFLALERIRLLMEEEKLSFREAKEEVIASSVFTTHTPVPAGNDVFSPQLIHKYFGDYQPRLGLDWKTFLGLGRQDPNDDHEGFCMTVLAIRLSSFTNGVSKLHSEVSKKMWRKIYTGMDLHDVPVRALTNGIHIRSWISDDLWGLFDRYLGGRWVHEPANDSVWQRIDDIPDAELWRTHERRRERLVGFARRELRRQLEKRGAPISEQRLADEALRPDALTIGFARRFATYKRGNLLFTDLARLKSILCGLPPAQQKVYERISLDQINQWAMQGKKVISSTEIGAGMYRAVIEEVEPGRKPRPLQIVMAGKAHPRDHEGKTLIKNIIHWIRDEELRGRIVFLENYDINVARYMVQGVDVWLNNPRRPMEASGTSGMKASANGALNLSILDGWWVEGYNVNTGWAIGRGEEASDFPGGDKEQDLVESKALYDVLEKEVVPTFYDNRGTDDTPRGWLRLMKSSMSQLNAVFNTNRMVRNYTVFFYIPCATRVRALRDDTRGRVRQLAAWKEKLERQWGAVTLEGITQSGGDDLRVGQMYEVNVTLRLGELAPEDVKVEIYFGMLDTRDAIVRGSAAPMSFQEMRDGRAVFRGSIPLTESGRHGFSVRIMPSHTDLFDRVEPGYIKWS
ncbi:MAG: alpha-glucan family phosphorylase [Nitrospinae bacterium]|nr:alpha-glucan family phosphorylase [Nitrospinota bacterium]